MSRIFVLMMLMVTMPVVGNAQILNGGFESGASWSLTGDATIGAAGGVTGGYGYVGVGVGTSTGAISQTFNCPGSPGDVCEVQFMYRILHPPSGSAVLGVRIDSQSLASISGPVGGWTAGMVTTSCGVHTLTFDITVTSGTVCLDNVSAACVPGVPVRHTIWGSIKRLYR